MRTLELKRWYITYKTIHVAQVMIFLKQCVHKSIFYMFALNEGLSWYQRSVPCDASTCFWIPSWGPMSRRRKKNLSDSFNDVTHGKTIICLIFFVSSQRVLVALQSFICVTQFALVREEEKMCKNISCLQTVPSLFRYKAPWCARKLYNRALATA